MRIQLPKCPYNLTVLSPNYVVRIDKFQLNHPGFLEINVESVRGYLNTTIPFYIEARHFNYHLYISSTPGQPMDIYLSETYKSSEVSDRRWNSNEVIIYYSCKLLNLYKELNNLENLEVVSMGSDTIITNSVC